MIRTLMWTCAQKGNVEMARMLFEAGFSPLSSEVADYFLAAIRDLKWQGEENQSRVVESWGALRSVVGVK